MNYQHKYHAGNFADVIKHLVLTHIILELKEKIEPFCVIDSHAGQGLYDLTSEAANKTGEAQKGILHLLRQGHVHPLLLDYVNIIATYNPESTQPRFYPGSPKIAQALLRPQDQLYVNELHPVSYESLYYIMKSDKRVTLSKLDGYKFIKAILPPALQRGVVLIDAPFEKKDEVNSIINSLQCAVKCFDEGIYLIWYPIKNNEIARELKAETQIFYTHQILDIQFYLGNIADQTSLNATGLLILNPPQQLQIKIEEILKIIQASYGDPKTCRYIIDFFK